VDNASPELQPEFLRMQSSTNEELVAIAQAQVETSQHERQTELLAKNEESLLTSDVNEQKTWRDSQMSGVNLQS